MERLLQLFGDWLVKDIRVDLTQRFIAPRIRLGAPVGEPALCRFPRSRHQSDPSKTRATDACPKGSRLRLVCILRLKTNTARTLGEARAQVRGSRESVVLAPPLWISPGTRPEARSPL
jgi:hypothetical protein